MNLDHVEFDARVVPYSSVVGSSIMLTDKAGVVIGQVALLSFGDKDAQEYWAKRIARALNNGAKAERAIEQFMKRGLIKTMGECEEGKGGAVRSKKGPVDLNAFVKSLDAGTGEANNELAIRRHERAADGQTDGAHAVPDVQAQEGSASVGQLRQR